MNILICDDAMFMRTMLSNIVTKHSYQVAGEASNVREAIELYKDLKPDIVTMDITMPEMTGIDGLKLLKEIDPGVKVIMCSAMGQQPMIIEAIQAGAADFIVKPFREERVIAALEKVQRKEIA